MSATNYTANYGLPVFVSSDVPSWLTDWNGAMGDIDTAIAAAKAAADSALLASGNNTANITTIQGQITTINGTLGTHTTQIGTISGNINTINSLIGNGTPTTTDQTIIGAINELAAIVEAGSEVITTSTVDSDVRTKVLNSISKGRVPYIVAEYTSGGNTFHNVVFRLVQTGFGSTYTLVFSAVIDSNNIRVLYIATTGTSAQDVGATLGTMTLYY